MIRINTISKYAITVLPVMFLAVACDAVPSQVQPNSNETAGWRTYLSEESGFEISYPLDWEITDSNIIIPTSNAKHCKISSEAAGDNCVYFEIQGIVKEAFNYYNAEKKVAFLETITDLPVKRFGEHEFRVLYNVFKGTGDNLYFIKGPRGGYFGFKYHQQKDRMQETNARRISQILSTFRFIWPNVPISEWKIYSNEQYGFEMKYPINADYSIEKNVVSFQGPNHNSFTVTLLANPNKLSLERFYGEQARQNDTLDIFDASSGVAHEELTTSSNQRIVYFPAVPDMIWHATVFISHNDLILEIDSSDEYADNLVEMASSVRFIKN